MATTLRQIHGEVVDYIPVCAKLRLHVIAVDQENGRAPFESAQGNRRVERPRVR
jgi:hypothetical protein